MKTGVIVFTKEDQVKNEEAKGELGDKEVDEQQYRAVIIVPYAR